VSEAKTIDYAWALECYREMVLKFRAGRRQAEPPCPDKPSAPAVIVAGSKALIPDELRDFASLMVDEVIAKARAQLTAGVSLCVADQLLMLEQLTKERDLLARATPAIKSGG
jgi:hypothetical protein